MESFYTSPEIKAMLTVGAPNNGVPSDQSHAGQCIKTIVNSPAGKLMIRVAIRTAPNLPTVVALEEAFESLIGDEAFTNDMKQYTGYLIRLAVEDMGGSLNQKGVKITRRSRYTRGAIYSL